MFFSSANRFQFISNQNLRRKLLWQKMKKTSAVETKAVKVTADADHHQAVQVHQIQEHQVHQVAVHQVAVHQDAADLLQVDHLQVVDHLQADHHQADHHPVVDHPAVEKSQVVDHPIVDLHLWIRSVSVKSPLKAVVLHTNQAMRTSGIQKKHVKQVVKAEKHPAVADHLQVVVQALAVDHQVVVPVAVVALNQAVETVN
jgi:hypothetical protein